MAMSRMAAQIQFIKVKQRTYGNVPKIRGSLEAYQKV